MSDLAEIRDEARRFIAERDWGKFQDPKSVMLALVGEVGELAELLQWLPADEAKSRMGEEPLHTRVGEELADVLIYLIGLADPCGVDLRAAAMDKLAKASAKYPRTSTMVSPPSVCRGSSVQDERTRRLLLICQSAPIFSSEPPPGDESIACRRMGGARRRIGLP